MERSYLHVHDCESICMQGVRMYDQGVGCLWFEVWQPPEPADSCVGGFLQGCTAVRLFVVQLFFCCARNIASDQVWVMHEYNCHFTHDNIAYCYRLLKAAFTSHGIALLTPLQDPCVA
jgi:hypothetical protein